MRRKHLKAIPIHPLAAIIPEMSLQAYDDLASSIREHGLMEPIVLLDGAILDGRNRYRACIEIGTEPRFIEYTQKSSAPPDEFVWAENVARRHLTDDQRTMILQKINGWNLEQEALERKRAAGKAQGEHGKKGGRGNAKPHRANSPEGVSSKPKDTHATRKALAEKAKVSTHKALEKKRAGGKKAGRGRPQKDRANSPEAIAPKPKDTHATRKAIAAKAGVSTHKVRQAQALLAVIDSAQRPVSGFPDELRYRAAALLDRMAKGEPLELQAPKPPATEP